MLAFRKTDALRFRLFLVLGFIVHCQSATNTIQTSGSQNKYKTQKSIETAWEKLSPSGIKSLSYMYMMGDGDIKFNQLGEKNSEKVERFKIGSITKLFTGIAILQLQDARKLKLDDPASKFLPELKLMTLRKKEFREITIRDLLTHQSGLPSDLASGFFLPPNSTEDEILKAFHNLPNKVAKAERNEPGKIHSYSNLAFGLLGNLIERVSGLNIEDYFRKNIFEKADMKNTTLLEFMQNSDLVSGYTGLLWKSQTERPLIRDLTAGSISTTGEDMGKFMKLFFQSKNNKGLLSKSSFEEFHKIQAGPKANFEMKLGLPVIQTNYSADGKNITLYGHSGSLPPFISDLIYDPKMEIVSFVSGNTLGLQSGKLKTQNEEAVKLLWEEKMGTRLIPKLPPPPSNPKPKEGEEGFYVSPFGIHEYKKGNPSKLNLFGFDMNLIEKESNYGIDLRILFGLIKVKDPMLEKMRIEFETWEGNSIFTLFSEDLTKGTAGIGVKFNPDNQFPSDIFMGTFISNEPYALIPKIRLDVDKRGFPLLTIYLKLSGIESKTQVPCKVESPNALRILGYGRNLGERILLENRNGLSILHYSGGEYFQQ